MFPWNTKQADFEYDLFDESENTDVPEEPISQYGLNAENLCREIYDSTKILLPRTAFLNLDSTESESSEVYKYLRALALAHHDSMIEQTELHQQEIEKILQTKSETISNEKQNSVDLQELNRLKSEIANLSKSLKEERHKINKLEKDKISLKEQYQTEHEELLLLREYMYAMDNDEEETEDEKKIQIGFPYSTKRHIVCLGGTESWINYMSDKLPDVVFHKPNVTTNADKFKSADEIWIQICGLNHKEYFPVRDLAKSRGIPVNFFKYSGARKCAEQFARHDMCMK